MTWLRPFLVFVAPLDEPRGAGLEQGMRGVGKGAGEIAVHRNHAALLELGTHDDEVRAAEAFAEPMWCGPGKRPTDLHAVAADVVDEPGDMPGHDEAAALTARPPWHGYTLGDWTGTWERFAQRATVGDWEENGRETLARRRSDVTPETPARPVEQPD